MKHISHQRAIKLIKHNGNNNAMITDGKHCVRIAYGDMRCYVDRHIPIEAVHCFGKDWETLYLKLRHTETRQIKYYRGSSNRRLDPNVKSRGSVSSAILVLPSDSMTYGMALLDYTMNGDIVNEIA